jgi:uncharacterized protein YbcI
MGTEEEPPTTTEEEQPGQTASAISRELVRLYSRKLGRGPTKARTTVNTNTVMVVFQETLTRSELTLLRAGQGTSVVATRLSMAEAMRSDATEIVESLTERTVTAYVPGLDVDANVAVLAFLLDPVPETGSVVIAEQDEGEEPRLTELGGLPEEERTGLDSD